MTVSTESSELSDLELAVLRKLLTGDDPVLSALSAQLVVCTVDSRHYSGLGFFTDLAVSTTVPPAGLTQPTLYFGDVVAELHQSSAGAGFLVVVRDGYLATLEGYVFDGDWPFGATVESLRYYPDPRDLSALKC